MLKLKAPVICATPKTPWPSSLGRKGSGAGGADGRTYHTWNRDYVYEVLSVEGPLQADGDSVGEILLDSKQSVEVQVWSIILRDDIEELMIEEEWRLFEAKRVGLFSHHLF